MSNRVSFRNSLLRQLQSLQRETVVVQNKLAEARAKSAAKNADSESEEDENGDSVYSLQNQLDNLERISTRLMNDLQDVDEADDGEKMDVEESKKRKRDDEVEQETKRIRLDEMQRKKDLALLLVSTKHPVFQEQILGVSKDIKKSFQEYYGIGIQPMPPSLRDVFIRSNPSEKAVIDRLFRPGNQTFSSSIPSEKSTMDRLGLSINYSSNNNAALKYCIRKDYRECVSKLFADERLREITPEVLSLYMISDMADDADEETRAAWINDPRTNLSTMEIQSLIQGVILHGIDNTAENFIQLLWKKLNPKKTTAVFREILANTEDERDLRDFVMTISSLLTPEQRSILENE